MDSKIIDSSHLFFKAEEPHRLSYDMLFNEGRVFGGRRRSKASTAAEESRSSGISEEELKEREQEWREKLKKATDRARRQGLEEGRALGREEAMETVEERLGPIQEAMQAVDQQIVTLLDDIKPYVATLVFDLAEKVMELPINNAGLRERIATEVRKILASIERDVKVSVTIAETDYEFIVRALKDSPYGGHIEIDSCDKLRTGEYYIDTQNERIVKSFKKVLRDFREKVALEVREEHKGE